jgi:hypothetical protein
MLWQPAHSPTPPVWNAKTGENPITTSAAIPTMNTVRIALIGLPPEKVNVQSYRTTRADALPDSG